MFFVLVRIRFITTCKRYTCETIYVRLYSSGLTYQMKMMPLQAWIEASWRVVISRRVEILQVVLKKNKEEVKYCSE